MGIVIRAEQAGDIEKIEQLTQAAFAQVPYSDHTEQFIVNALRKAAALSVSLVAEYNGVLVGHIALSPVSISDGTDRCYGLGPVAVLPDEQGKGIGSALIEAAIEQLKQLNANCCVLLGDPGFYCRFGFKTIDGLVLTGVPAEYFQALVLQPVCPQGSVNYHQAFTAKA